ncbi:hypothetical protein K469DRAFT_803464 [Zopfia rhizophila CBS 207.26]|uniref:SnoaL-like domain-containing protein n=1 Tax=Zopfia rhizophila CBS 207.26 TaxID=1314779 RepID=A0A6A6DJY8_9PEZI|nr:hypothetical protein K469DRAFT_803464 [Zopfia rhizophila CBS 207.26]
MIECIPRQRSKCLWWIELERHVNGYKYRFTGKPFINSSSFFIYLSLSAMMSSQIPTSLPPLVLSVIEAIKSLDISQFVSCFSDGAVLVDKSKRHSTLASIQEWFNGLRDHKATIKIQDTGISESEVWVHVMMDGNYETAYGITEPFPLYLHFFFHKDWTLKLLRINQISPNEPTMRAV